MTAKEKAAKIKKLNRQIAVLEAKLTGLKADLAKLQLAPGEVAQVTGLDLLWDAALPKSRERSSRQLCRVEWNRIPAGQRPKVQFAVDALKAWNKCEQWTKDGNAYAKGLHLFIKNRMWEDVPTVRDPLSRYRPVKPGDNGLPAAFVEWAKQNYSLDPRSCWNLPNVRAEWEASASAAPENS